MNNERPLKIVINLNFPQFYRRNLSPPIKVVLDQKNNNGKSIKEIISSVIDDIEASGKKAYIIFKFIASDGNSITNQFHIDFNKYINDFKII